ncbi:MAG: 6-carboxytetrahydropterin synthase [candidate division Zixibacteria bacterium]|nr:6-carboxytetrahydropterin synthase [candidate division Zixibacteria bacterium]
MYLTISKRFEISSSARVFRAGWSDDRNLAVYGPACRGEFGHGYNYVARFVFHGPVDPATGMVMNVTIIKARIAGVLNARYDHKFLNRDTSPFADIVPTPENVAVHMLRDVTSLFDDQAAHPVACELHDAFGSGATAYADGRVERRHLLEFSAARRTCSPHLSDEENDRLFGIAARKSGHGHNYALWVTLAGDVDDTSGVIVPHHEVTGALQSLHHELDHRNLNTDCPGLTGLPITTESLTRYAVGRLRTSLPVKRVRLYEMRSLFAECDAENAVRLGTECLFHAAHRLHSPRLSAAQNIDIYDKCNNPAGHGHEYRVEPLIGGDYDDVSGTLYDFVEFRDAVARSIEPWTYRHLDMDTDDFKESPSTGENIVSVLWPRLDTLVAGRLVRLRLWETPNNRFTLARAAQ